MGKSLIVLGVVLIVIGAAVTWGVPLGRLPGDISIKRGNFGFYFPLATSIIISLLLTLLMTLFRRG
jgi:hypothetical protein